MTTRMIAPRVAPYAGTAGWFRHRFTPDPRSTMRTQCRLCFGWRDDPRHL